MDKRWSDSYFEGLEGYDCLEIGALDGMTTRYLASRFRRVFVIDPWDGRQEGVPHKYSLFMENAGNLPNVFHCRAGSETEEARRFLAESQGLELGFAYVDGLHNQAAVINDWGLADAYMRQGGIVFVDDCGQPGRPMGDVSAGCDMYMAASDAYEEMESVGRSMSVWNEDDGLTRIFRKKR